MLDVSKFMAAGNSLTPADLPQATQTWTIKNVDQQQLGQGQKAEEKVCMHFHDHEKFLSMNKTNLKRLVGPPLNWSTDADTWVNRQVQVYRAWTEYKGDAVMGVRLWAPGQTPPDPIIDINGNPAVPNPLAMQAPQPRSRSLRCRLD